MLKKSSVNQYLLSAARALYLFATVTAVFAALAFLGNGGH